MKREDEVLAALRPLRDPASRESLVDSGAISGLRVDAAGSVAFAILLAQPGGPDAESIKSQAEAMIRQLSWVTDVTLFTAPRPKPAQPTRPPGLKAVKRILAVSSCKGGVGKSTVAVNLAFQLAGMGRKVGIFDADVYGPSLPTMVNPEDKDLRVIGDLIQPLEYNGVRLMSFGYVNTGPQGGPAIMRGPMVSQVINQLLTTTAWGELDYLVIDFPPGTGDVQLTLLQLVPITAAVIVTTPQQLSFVDVVKGIQMFDKLKVPTIAVVENMSYFDCGKCSERHYLFGQGARRQLVEQFGIRNSLEIPLLPELSQHGDAGEPAIVASRSPVLRERYQQLAQAVEQEIASLSASGAGRPTVTHQAGHGIRIETADGKSFVLSPAVVRRACRCAHCVEEFSGRPLLKPESVSETITPTSIQSMGNYAVAITWSDGHASSIYPFDTLLGLAAGQKKA